MSKYRLYYAPDNASLIIRLVMDEMGLSYSTQLIDRSRAEQQGSAYLQRNPRGLIPALDTEHGSMFETAAILLWLGDKHKRMIPSVDAADRGPFLSWLFFLSNGLHADLRQSFYPEKYAMSPELHDQHHAKVSQRILDQFQIFDDAAAQRHSWINGANPSVIDYYLACCMRWAALYPAAKAGWFKIDQFPHLQSLAKQLETRDAALKAAKAEGLGETPFSAPSYARPPEGSAT